MFLRIRGGGSVLQSSSLRWTRARTIHAGSQGVLCFSQCSQARDGKTSDNKYDSQDASGSSVTGGGQEQPRQRVAVKKGTITLSEQQDKQEQKRTDQQKKGGFGLPALAIFAVGFPLGWYLSDYRPFGKSNGSSGPSDFIKYTLSAKEDVSSTAAIFRLRPSSKAPIDLDDPNLERAITSVEFKQPQLQIARSYTCLPQERGQHMDELRFLIRRERKGEVSNYLHRLPNNADIDVRGLYPEYVLPADIKSVAFLVGGTGIAPAMQAADILAGEADIHILWSSRRREDCIGGCNDTKPAGQRWSFWPGSTPVKNASAAADLHGAEKGALVAMLERLKAHSVPDVEQRSRLSVDYFVDEEGSFVGPEDVKHMLDSLSRSDESGRKILIVSGPEGFLSHWAGSKQWAGGREVQGPLRGVLSTLDLKGWEVVKL